MTSSASHLLTAGLTREQRGDLLARLSDEDVRGIVWQLIEAQSQLEPAPEPDDGRCRTLSGEN